MQKRPFIFIVMPILLASLTYAQTTSLSHHGKKDRSIRVMTRNLDAGSDFGYVLQAASNPNSTQLDLLMAISQTYQEMIASNISARAEGIAEEIRGHQPDLIGLQEVTTLRTGAYGAPADVVVVDGLQALLRALGKRGLHYKPIAVQTNAVVDLPALDASYKLISVGFTDYDAVLARTDLPISEFRTFDVKMQHFTTSLPFSVAGQTIPFLRGWISVEVKSRGKEFKFVTTHLETFSPDVQAAQTNELISGPLASHGAVVLAGDLNSDAYQPSWANGPAIEILEAAGFRDIWNKLHPYNPGLTWPLFSEDPNGPATPRQRIDLILSRGNDLRSENIARTGVFPFDGSWASDHTGVFGVFELRP